MSKNALAEVLLKIAGLYWFLLACSQVLSIAGAQYLYERPHKDLVYGIVLPHIMFSLIYGIGSFLLLRKTKYFLKIMNLSEDPGIERIVSDSKEIEIFGFAILGAYFFVDGISYIVNGTAFYFDQQGFDSQYHQAVQWRTFLPELIRGCISIALSLFLFFGRRTIYNLWLASRPMAKKIAELRGSDINDEAS